MHIYNHIYIYDWNCKLILKFKNIYAQGFGNKNRMIILYEENFILIKLFNLILRKRIQLLNLLYLLLHCIHSNSNKINLLYKYTSNNFLLMLLQERSNRNIIYLIISSSKELQILIWKINLYNINNK